jgi:HEAT repeat protein
MKLAGAQRLARRVHRGEVDETGRAYAAHLERVAALVAAEDGDERQQMAAWLHGTGRAGLRPRDLAALGVPGRVIEIIAALTPRQPWEHAHARAARVRVCPGAALVLRADVTDLSRPEARAASPGSWQYQADRYRDLLDQAGARVPDSLLGLESASQASSTTVSLSQLDPDDPGRWAAVRAFGAVGDVRAAGPLIAAYRAAASASDSRWSNGKHWLAAALSKIAASRRHQADSGWVATLVRLAADRDPFLRATAIRGLAGLAEHEQLIIGALSDPSPQVVDAALGSLSGIGELARTLTSIAGRLEPEWTWPRRHAVRLLVKARDPQARAVLVNALAADGMGLGHDMLSFVGRDGDRSVVPVLVSQVRDGARGWAAAVYLLGEWRARETVGDLVAALASDPADLQFRIACIEALGKIADPVAVPVLAAQAVHHLAWVRTSALLALSRISHPDVARIALDATEDFDPGVRDRAIRVLAALGGPEATARLLTLCAGPLAPVALRGLARIADERAVIVLTQVFLDAPDRRLRHLAGRALARSALRAPAIYSSTSMTPAQARAIAWVLGEISDTNSSRTLIGLLTHRDALVRARAAAALGKIANQQTAPALRAALADISPAVRAATATSLGRLGMPEAAAWLEPSLGDVNPAVRAATEAAIRRLRPPASSTERDCT